MTDRAALITARAVGALALVEARRLLVHPAYLALAGYLLLVVGVRSLNAQAETRASVVSVLALLFLLAVPLLSLFPANLVASSARRANAEELLAAAVLGARTRTTALCIAALGPAAVGAAGASAYWWVAYRAGPVPADALLPEAVASAPLLYVGAGTLGVATARWLPVPGAALAVMVGLVAWTAALGPAPTRAWLCPWVVDYAGTGGSHLWHAVYLLGLCGLAAVAALLRHPGRRRTLLLTATLIALLTALAAWAQLP